MKEKKAFLSRSAKQLIGMAVSAIILISWIALIDRLGLTEFVSVFGIFLGLFYYAIARYIKSSRLRGRTLVLGVYGLVILSAVAYSYWLVGKIEIFSSDTAEFIGCLVMVSLVMLIGSLEEQIRRRKRDCRDSQSSRKQ